MFMNEVIERGDAEEIKDDGIEGEKWYISHHGVYHSKKLDKLRVVFDCSAQYEGTSLNENLSGPDLINNLIGILIQFRQHPIACVILKKCFISFTWIRLTETTCGSYGGRMESSVSSPVSSA